VSDTEAGLRLDAVLAKRLGISRRAAARLAERGVVRHNGAAASKGHLVHAGDVLDLPADAGREDPVARPDLPLVVLAQGPGWVSAIASNARVSWSPA